MRLVIQRVREATVEVDHKEVVHIGPGLVVFVGFTAHEEPTNFPRIAEALVRLRIFDDDAGRLNRSLTDAGGEVLVVPEITLVASLAKGYRPSFDVAAGSQKARDLFEAFVRSLQAIHPNVSAGIFQAHMVVHLANDGPVTFVIDDPNHLSVPPKGGTIE